MAFRSGFLLGAIGRHRAECLGNGYLGRFSGQNAIVDVTQAIEREIGLIFV